MLKKSIFGFAIALVLSVSSYAQRPEVSFTLNETFFDALLDSIFQNFEPPEFSLATVNFGIPEQDLGVFRRGGPASEPDRQVPAGACAETIKMLRDTRGVRTAVRFRDGRINVPLAFSGTYSPPLVGCIEFAGWADAEIDLISDADAGRLSGRIKVAAVNLNGTGGLGGSLIARLLQSSIDKRVNPVQIVSLDKVSFSLPVHKNGVLRMQARRLRTEVLPGALNIRVEYDFVKG
jgi:hypothetical protein